MFVVLVIELLVVVVDDVAGLRKSGNNLTGLVLLVWTVIVIIYDIFVSCSVESF